MDWERREEGLGETGGVTGRDGRRDWERREEGLGEMGGGTGRDGRRDWERREEGLGETGGGTGRDGRRDWERECIVGKTNVKTDKLTLTHEEGEKANLFLKAYLVKKNAICLYYKVYSFSEFLEKVLREKYQHLTVPVCNSVELDSDKPVCLEDAFVEMHLQKHTEEKFPEKFSYDDLKEMETRVQSNDAIPIAELFSNLGNGEHQKTMAPTKVLIRGQPGVGKSTLAKHIANQWARGALWPDIKYTFLVPIKELPQRETWSLSNLLLDELIPPEHHAACLDVINGSPEEILVFLDGYDEGGGSDQQEGQSNKEDTLSTLISRIINNGVLPGAKVLVSSRPTKQLPVKAFNHSVQLCGFTSEMVSKYVHKNAHTKEEEEFIMKHLDASPSMAGLCQVPLLCAFVCVSLTDKYTCAENAEAPAVNTTTDLYVQSTVQTASKLHPHLKYSKEATDLDDLFDIIEAPLRKHADLARYSVMSSPPKFIFYKDDLDKFDFDETDRNCGFLVEMRTQDPRFKRVTRSYWAFSHTTMQEFFAAVGMLRSDDSVWECLSNKTRVEQLKTMVMFMGGLLGDTGHSYYVEHLVSSDATRDSQKLTTRLTEMLIQTRILTQMMDDDAMMIATVFETQNPDMVQIVPTEIKSSNMSMMDMHALVWVLENENGHITSLK